jgi:arabinogalactan oligomer/maltooligosaccharide transport system permease protein
VIVLLAILLAAPKPVLLWHAYRGAEEEALNRLLTRYNDSQSDYRAEALALPYDAFASKLTSAIPGGHGPDLFLFAHERLGGWAREGYVAKVSYSGPFAEAVTVDGKSYGIPLALKSVALFYDKSLISTPPATLNEMAEAARKLTGNGVYGLAYPALDFYDHAAFLHAFGGRVFQEPDHRAVLDTPQAIEALAFVRKLALEDKVIPEEPTSILVTSLFNQHKAAMVINGPWFIGEIKNVDYGIAPLPKPMRPFLSVESAILSGRAREPEGALQVALMLASPEASRVREQVGGQVVIEGGTDPRLAAFRAQAESAVPMDSSPQMLAVWEPEKRALASVLGGDATPAEALAQAQRRLIATTKAAPPQQSAAPDIVSIIIILGMLTIVAAKRIEKLPVFRNTARAYAYVAPAFVSILVLVFIPFAAGMALAFFHHDSGHYTFVGLSNFVDILLSRDYRITEPMSFYFTLAVTLLWTVCNVALHASIGLALALLLKDPLLRFKSIYRVLLIVPWAVPNYITALVWKGMFHRQFGAVSALLAAFGIQPISWFTRFSTAFAANVITNTWLGFPFMMVVALGALQSIPQDLYEAASVDGASKWSQFKHITLPLLKPALLPAIILGSVWTFNMFNIIYLVSGGEPGGSTDILVSEAYRWAFQRNEQFGFAAAYSTLIFLFLLGYSALTRKIAAEPA